MKEKNMIDFKNYSNIGSHSCKKNFLKRVYHSLKEPAFIGSLNGTISGAIATTLATYGYIALPGLGPIITMGIGIAFFIGMIIGAMIGSIIGILVGTFYAFIA
ncbi:hypothetical protein [Bartonella acomydis]|uniref:hypothetical protein n=1 Tax=Bartonella acomydis TaxID=686234 RepID=UPI0031EFF204